MLAIDVGAMLLPGVPAVAGMILRGGEAAKAAAAVAKASKSAEKVAAAVERVRKAGQWVKRTEQMSDRARAYQRFITGVGDDLAFKLNGVHFDAFRNNALIDAKGYYNQFVDEATGEFKVWFQKDGAQKMLKEAQSQIKAAGGATIEWHFNEAEALEATRKLFEQNKITGIDLVLHPMP